MRLTLRLQRGLVILALLAIWEVAVRLGGVDSLFLSPPTDIAVKAVALFGVSDIRHAFAIALWELVGGFGIAAPIGVGFGLLVGLSPLAYRIFYPLVSIFYGLPKVTVLPVFILVFGIGVAPKVAFGAFQGVFPILITVIAGARMINPHWVKAARSMGARPGQLFAHVLLPAAMPAVVTGMRLGLTQTLLGVLLGELFISQAGVGRYIIRYTSSFKTAETFAMVLILAAMAVIIGGFFRHWEARVARASGSA